jgi:NAD(P)H-nitrite reductase large subunit
MKVVIIGNSAAAAGCIEALNAAGAAADITVVTDESKAIYGRPLISYYLWGKTREQNMYYRDGGYYEKNGAKLVTDTRIEKIDVKAKKAVSADGTEFPYDKLLIATGSSPAFPPIEGVSRENTHTFMTWQDADRIKEKLTGETDVVIAGAGLIGLKAAESVSAAARSVKVVELAERVLPTVLDAVNAPILQDLLEKKGIEFYLSRSVKKVEGEGSVNKVVLSDGTELDCSLFILAAGVRPNTALAKDAGITVNRGIPVDAYSRTNIPDIYAAGDVTESTDHITKDKKIMALWPNAYLQGEAAGNHMAGKEAEPPQLIPMNAVTFFGYPIITAGIIGGEGAAVIAKKTADGVKNLYVKDNTLQGMALFNAVERAGIYTSLIKDKVKIGNPEDLVSDSFGLNWFDKDERQRKMLGL